MSKHYEHQLNNGMTLLVEPVSGVRSASMTLLVPGGVSYETNQEPGLANFVSAMVSRGAGNYDNHALMHLQDELGLQHNESAEIVHSSFTVAMLADYLDRAVDLTSQMVREPHFPDDQIEPCRAGILQDIQAIEDEPSQKLFIELRSRLLPHPLGRPILGTADAVEKISKEDVSRFHHRTFEPSRAILGIAGAVDFDSARESVERYFAGWEGTRQADPDQGSFPANHVVQHVPSDKVQTHIGMAFESVAYPDADYFLAHAAASVLSGGMSARLWTEVREKRGLCYSVSAMYAPYRDFGVLFAHAATTSEDRATETVDVMRKEIQQLVNGISDEEIHRVQAGLKASLVMQQESTSARANMLARNWYYLNRVRTVEEIAREIDALSAGKVVDFLKRRPLREIGIVTLGPTAVETAA